MLHETDKAMFGAIPRFLRQGRASKMAAVAWRGDWHQERRMQRSFVDNMQKEKGVTAVACLEPHVLSYRDATRQITSERCGRYASWQAGGPTWKLSGVLNQVISSLVGALGWERGLARRGVTSTHLQQPN